MQSETQARARCDLWYIKVVRVTIILKAEQNPVVSIFLPKDLLVIHASAALSADHERPNPGNNAQLIPRKQLEELLVQLCVNRCVLR